MPSRSFVIFLLISVYFAVITFGALVLLNFITFSVVSGIILAIGGGISTLSFLFSLLSIDSPADDSIHSNNQLDYYMRSIFIYILFVFLFFFIFAWFIKDKDTVIENRSNIRTFRPIHE